MQTLQKKNLWSFPNLSDVLYASGCLQSWGSNKLMQSSASPLNYFPSSAYTIILCLQPCLTRPLLRIPFYLCGRPTQTSQFPSTHLFSSQSQIISRGTV